MKCLRISKFRNPITFEKIEPPKLSLNTAQNKHEILIKVHFSPINPSDLGFANGIYGSPEFKNSQIFPRILGFEGSGIIKDSSVDKRIIGKPVAFYSENSGAWCEYTTSSTYILLDHIKTPDSIPMQKASCLFINPLTALSFVNIIINQNEKVALNTAGNSALGKIFRRLCKYRNIQTINLIRNEPTSPIKDEIFINILEPNYVIKLKEICHSLKCKIAFDSIGGDTTGNILNALPSESTLVHYGNLSLRNIGKVQTEDILFRKKSIVGFWLFDYYLWNELILKEAMEKIIQTGIFDTEINSVYTPEKVEDALANYRKTWSRGKTILQFI